MSADLQFKQLIDRILRCREAEDEAKADTKAVYAELKGHGYDKTAAGALVAEIRKRESNPAQHEERSAMLDLYRDAYDRASHTHTRENNTNSAPLMPNAGEVTPSQAQTSPASHYREASGAA